MNYNQFKGFLEISAKVAIDIAQANGVSLAQAQLWLNTAKAEKNAPLTCKPVNFKGV